MREVKKLNEAWSFHRGDIEVPPAPDKSGMYKSAKTERAKWGPAALRHGCKPDNWGNPHEDTSEKWTLVNLPHDYTIEQVPAFENPQSTGYFKYENAWYAKYFKLEESDKDKRISLVFDGVSTKATVYVNGCLMYHSFCAYVPFEVDITDVALFGQENKVAVFVESGPAHEGWWYDGAGIYRHVWIKKTAMVSVDQWGVFVSSEKVDAKNWNTKIQTEIRNDNFEEKTVCVTSTVLYNGEKVAETATENVTVPTKYKTKVEQIIPVCDPKLWNVEDTQLYTLHTTVTENGEIIDETDTTYGYRTIEFDANKGFLLNGVRTKIHGVCCHQDFGITGRAIPDNVCRYKVRLIKEMGANGYRTSHYPHTEAIYDACDREGLLVMAETRWFESSKESIEQLETMIKRDRNHPSVIMWSIGNEEAFAREDRGGRIAKTMNAAVKRLDATRPVTMAVDLKPLEAKVYDACDIIGVNYNIEELIKLHEAFPDKCIFSSENCASGTRRGDYVVATADRLPMAYDQDANNWFRGRQYSEEFLSEPEWLAGGFQWIAIDHRGESVWPALSSLSGAIDLYLIKKDSFYLNQSFWLKQPMIHLFPHMDIREMEGETVKFWAYTNCDEAELFLNGKSLGRQTVKKYARVEWEVEYQTGTMTAVGYRNGEKVVEETHATSTGKAYKLCLKAENANDITANGEDILMVTCWCEDENGLPVEKATPTVTFKTNYVGTVAGTGAVNTDHTPPACPTRQLFAGKCSAAIKLGKTNGTLRVYAESDGLIPARIDVEVQ